MTTSNKASLEEPTDRGRWVAEYLLAHPEFFLEHQNVLATITLPHHTGKTVSLIEKQVALLRTKNDELNQQLRDFVAIAKANDELSKRIHTLILALMDAGDLGDLIVLLAAQGRKRLNADEVAVRLYSKERPEPEISGFLKRGDVQRAVAEEIAGAGKPVCGRLKSGYIDILFSHSDNTIRSAIALPLDGERWGGVLAFGSSDPQRFQVTMRVDILSRLADIINRLVSARLG